MKVSELVAQIDVATMARELKFEQTQIKLALAGPGRKTETGSIAKIDSMQRARKLYAQANSRQRRIAIAQKALDLCTTRNDIRSWKLIINASVQEVSVVRGKHARIIRAIERASIEKAVTFREVHDVWIHLNFDMLAEEDLMAYEKLVAFIPTTMVIEVVQTFAADCGFEAFEQGHYGYELLILAALNAKPAEALEALKWIEWTNDHTYPVQILIKKAAELFRK